MPTRCGQKRLRSQFKITVFFLCQALTFIIAFALPMDDNEASGVCLSEARKYVSLPDLNDLTHLRSHHRDVNIWASKMRAARRSGGGDRSRMRQHHSTKSAPLDGGAHMMNHIERESAPPPPTRKSISPEHQGGPPSDTTIFDVIENDIEQSRQAPPSPRPFKRLIELPLWQTSLLSAKYVLHHESDVVTYRERTFPTARCEIELPIRSGALCASWPAAGQRPALTSQVGSAGREGGNRTEC